MAKTTNFLAFDLGAESGRAVVGRFDGERMTLEETHRFPNGPISVQGSLFWDVLRLFTEIKYGLSKTFQTEAGSIVSMGLDTWGVDFALLDRAGQLIGNPHNYRDSRTDGVLERTLAKMPREEIFAQTGVQFLQLNSLIQLMALVENDSPSLGMAHTFLTIPDLFNYWLTGQIGCEFTNATTTQCYNPLTGTWATPMLERLNIPTPMFPEIITPGTTLGPLTSLVAEETGVSDLSVIAPACHDTGSAVAAIPVQGSDFAWISSGTWSIMGVEVPEAVMNEAALAANLTNEGGVGDTFRLSKNVMGLWLVQESRRTWAKEGRDYSYDDLTAMAAQAASLQAVVEPDDSEFLKPGDMPARIRAYCERTGQPVPQSDGQIIRCILESLALKYRWVLERIEALIDRRLATIHIVGGGSQNHLLNQATADATGRPVVAGPVEATAMGNLMMQAISLGHLGSIADGREVVRRSFAVMTFEPAGDSAAWDEAFAKLEALIP